MKGLALALPLLAGCSGPVEESKARPAEPGAERAPSPPPPARERKKPERVEEPADFKLDDVKGEKLTFQKISKPLRGVKLDHELFVFTGVPSRFKELFGLHLHQKAPEEPFAHKPSDDVVLFVLWGERLGDPSPEGTLDHRTKRIVVTAKWSGRGMMDTGTPYRGYGFTLAPLTPGEYTVWVREQTAVDAEGPKLTKRFVFTIDE